MPSLRLFQRIAVAFILLSTKNVIERTLSFQVSHSPRHSRNPRNVGTPSFSKWSPSLVTLQMDKNDPNYYAALREASKDPKTFEAFVRRQQQQHQAKQQSPSSQRDTNISDTTYDSVSNSTSTDSAESSSPSQKKKGYVPIEQWDENRSKNPDKLSWDEKVQFDGQRFGNQFKQNEILRKNLKSW